MQFIRRPSLALTGIFLATILIGANAPRAVGSFETLAQPSVVRTLVVATPFEHLGLRTREPMLVEHPDGTLFVSGYGEPQPTLWKSRDGGVSWAQVNVGTEADGAVG